MSQGGTEEESLATGLRQYVARAQDASKVLSDFSVEGARLQSQVAALKQQLSDLTSTVSSKAALLVALEAEIEKVQAERDTLQEEQVRHLEAEEWWTSREALQESGPAGGRDEKGRAIRRAHSEMMEREKLAARIEQLEKEHDERIEKERAIAKGLRERVGKLDGRIRERETRIVELERVEKDLGAKLELQGEEAKLREAKLREEWKDMRAALDRTRQERDPAPSTVPSPRALRNITPNVQIPSTPPRPSPLPEDTLSGQKTTGSPSSACAKLKANYSKLDTAYQELRERFEDDRRCFKEYKAVALARENARKAQKAEKRERKVRASGRSKDKGKGASEAVPATSIPADPPAIAGQEVRDQENEEEEVEYESADVRVAREAAEAVDKGCAIYDISPSKMIGEGAGVIVGGRAAVASASTRDSRVQPPTPSPRSAARQLSPELRRAQVQAPTRVSESRQLRREPSRVFSTTPAVPAPVPTNREIRKTPSLDLLKKVEATRTTPWLGSTRRLGPSTSKSRLNNDLDDLGAPMEASPAHAHISHRTPLIRDRGDPSSLRRRALVPLPSAAPSTSIKAASTSPPPPAGHAESSTSKKRPLDMENLSPAEKALARKRLSKLSASEKREVYADYKGKGRYLAPAEVRKDIAGEYEIDARKNEGVKHAFHDVKRGREARKGMHGADCECCKGYYEAVGPLPVYNAPPKWNDAADDDEEDDDNGVREHQQKVSRHRDTWPRNPTPPGFWGIGFPSTQEVAKQNEDADKLEAEREARIRKEAAQKDGKWKKKA